MQKSTLNSENNQFIGISRGRKSTKIYTILDGIGNTVYFQLSGGNIHDYKVAVEFLCKINISNITILADKDYGTNVQMRF